MVNGGAAVTGCFGNRQSPKLTLLWKSRAGRDSIFNNQHSYPAPGQVAKTFKVPEQMLMADAAGQTGSQNKRVVEEGRLSYLMWLILQNQRLILTGKLVKQAMGLFFKFFKLFRSFFFQLT